jgi:hypothetical protein
MSNPDIDKVALTDYNLIIEEIFDESIFSMVAPSKKIGGVKVIGSSHLQVIRRVYTLTTGEDAYFKGRKIRGMPDASEWLSELLEPGKQVTTKPNGKVGMLNRYVGKKSIFTAKALEHYKKSVTLPFLRIYGEDPAPTRLLYGNGGYFPTKDRRASDRRSLFQQPHEPARSSALFRSPHAARQFCETILAGVSRRDRLSIACRKTD